MGDQQRSNQQYTVIASAAVAAVAVSAAAVLYARSQPRSEPAKPADELEHADEEPSVRSSSALMRCWDWLSSPDETASKAASPIEAPHARVRSHLQQQRQQARPVPQLPPLDRSNTQQASESIADELTPKDLPRPSFNSHSDGQGLPTPAQPHEAQRTIARWYSTGSSGSRTWLESLSAHSIATVRAASLGLQRLSGMPRQGPGWGPVLAGILPPLIEPPDSTRSSSRRSQDCGSEGHMSVTATTGQLSATVRSTSVAEGAVDTQRVQPEQQQTLQPEQQQRKQQQQQQHSPVRQPVSAALGASQQTVAEALISADLPAPQPLAHVLEPASADGDWGVVALDELQLYHHLDGQPWLLGSGSFGKVYKARYNEEDVAVKCFPLGDSHMRAEDNFRKEIDLLRSCRDDHVVAFKGACFDAPGHMLMIMELMDGGDLRTAINADAQDGAGALRWYTGERGPDGAPQEGLARAIALDIARGLEFLHAQHIVHLDVKSPNILLDRDNNAKLGDIGLARFMPHTYLSATKVGGSFVWAAPEVLMGAKCSTKVDIFSLGVILWELCAEEKPRRGRMRPLRVPEECPAGVARLIEACMAENAAHRPTAAEVADLLAGGVEALDSLHWNLFRASSDGAEETAQEPILMDERVLLQSLYNDCNFCIFGGRDAALAAGYTEPPVESVVEGIRPFDGKSYSHMVDQLKDLLQSPAIDDLNSPERLRLELLIAKFIPLYTTKLKMSTRVFQELRFTDVHELGKLVDAFPLSDDNESDTATTQGEPDSGRLERRHSQGAVSSGSSAVDEYAVEKSEARRQPPGAARWRAVLDAMHLTSFQLDAYAQLRQRVEARFAKLRAERKELVATLRRMAEDGDMSDYETAVRASSALRANMQAESHTLHFFQSEIICYILEPIQYARAEVAAFPVMHDGIPIGDLILADRGESASWNTTTTSTK